MIKKLGFGAIAIAALLTIGLLMSGGQLPQMTQGTSTAPLTSMTALAQDVVAPTTTTGTTTADAATDSAADVSAVAVKDFSIGPLDAKVKIIEYASFTCPHCARFHESVFKQLKLDYVDTGKVNFEFREVYFDRYGLWAAMVARCGGEMRYFGIASILFETQTDWSGSDDPALVVESLKKIGRTAGMDDATLDACMKDATTAKALMTHFETNFAADEIKGTPTLLINGEKHANMAYADLKAIIDAELAK
jgi:protein-disulfide isomerase